MDISDCNLCGTRNPEWVRQFRVPYEEQTSFQLVKCWNCGLVCVNPLPADAIIATHSRPYLTMLREGRRCLPRSRLATAGLRWLRRSRIPPARPGRLLDIGCSHGDYLAFVRSLGWQTQGIELDDEAARHARDVFGLDVATGRAEEMLG